MKTLDIIAVGELNPDLILAEMRADAPKLGTEQEVGRLELTLGSSTALCLVGLARLGLKTALVAKVGADEYGAFCLKRLREEGVNTDHVIVSPESRTGLTVSLTYPSDRLLATFPGSMRELRADEAPDELLARGKHLHVSSFFLQQALQPGLASLLERAKAGGLTTSLDTGWDPAEVWASAALEACLPHLDLLFPNEGELAALSAQPDPDEGAAWAFARGVRLVALKRGREGATFYQRNAAPLHQKAFSVEVVDTTGAGDAFDAGFLYGFLRSWEPGRSLELAAACGALTAVAVGGAGAFGNLDEVQRFLSES